MCSTHGNYTWQLFIVCTCITVNVHNIVENYGFNEYDSTFQQGKVQQNDQQDGGIVYADITFNTEKKEGTLVWKIVIVKCF